MEPRRFIPRTGLLLALATLSFVRPAAVAATSGLPDTSKMNVLFLLIEDCYAGVWGSYGNTICKTPNMDRFARTALRFDAAYVQGIACNPSRSSFLSGLRPLTTGVWNNSQNMSERLPPGTVTLPEMLKERGLYTAVIGKFFHTTEFGGAHLASFDRIEHYQPPPGWKGPGPIMTFPKNRPESPPPSKNKQSPEFQAWRRAHSDRYGDSGLKTEEEGDYRISLTAVALLEEFAKDRKQFFLSVHSSRPHTPLIAPKKYIDMYDPAKIPEPPANPSQIKGPFPYASRITGRNPDIFMAKPPTAQQAREAIAAYYACVSFVDDNMGRVLEALERTGLAKNTIVVALGDHGFHLGDHGMWSKYSLLEATRRAPLWVRVPGAPANGKVCHEFVEFVDFVPTLGELLGLNLPSNLEGTSFAPLLVNPAQPWKTAVFQVQTPGDQMVRTAQYSYLEFKDGNVPAALYDMQKDPWETVNLADDPGHASTRQEMAALLHAGWKAAAPKAR